MSFFTPKRTKSETYEVQEWSYNTKLGIISTLSILSSIFAVALILMQKETYANELSYCHWKKEATKGAFILEVKY